MTGAPCTICGVPWSWEHGEKHRREQESGICPKCGNDTKGRAVTRDGLCKGCAHKDLRPALELIDRERDPHGELERNAKRAACRRVLELIEREQAAPGGFGTMTLFDLYEALTEAMRLR